MKATYSRFQPSSLALGIALAVAAMQSAAQESNATEQANQEDTEVIEVRGIRASQAASLNAKRFTTEIIESITAEDIGKMPDQNISESLQRLPGIQIDRSNGEGTRVRIRGIGENATFLNGDFFLSGLETAKTGIAGGSVRSLSSLEGIPSELLGSVEIFKSPNAKLVEGGIGGTVNLKTRDAFDFEGLTIAGNAKGIYSQEAEELTPAFALVVGNNFNDEFAFVASVSSTETKRRQRGAQTSSRTNWDIVNADGSTSDPNRNYTAIGQEYILPEMLQPFSGERESKRLGATVSLQYRPNEAWELGANWFHSQLDTEQGRMSIKYQMANGETSGIDLSQPYQVDANGVIEQATFPVRTNEVNTVADIRDTKADNFDFYAKFDNGGPWRVDSKITIASAEQHYQGAANDVRQTQYAVPQPDASSASGWSHQVANPDAPSDFSLIYTNGAVPTINASIGDLLSNQNYGHFKSAWASANNSDLDATSVRVDVEYDLDMGALTTISFGGRIANIDSDWDEGFYLTDFGTAAGIQNTVAYPDGSGDGANGTWFRFTDAAIGGLASATDNRFSTGPLVVPWFNYTDAPERVQTINDFGSNVSGSVLGQSYLQMLSQGPANWWANLNPNNPTQYFSNPITTYLAERDTQALYFMADFLGEIGEMTYTFNTGARYIETDIAIHNFAPVPGGRIWGTDSWNGVPRDVQALTTERSYSDFLPSANFVLNITDDQKLRVAAAKVMSEQVLDDMGAGFNATFVRDVEGCNCFVFTGATAGNPELDPYRASQIDIAYEWYFSPESLASATLFYKKVESFIASATTPESFPDGSPNGETVGGVTRNINGDGGTVQGIELSIQHVFNSGLGFAANFTYSDSEAESLSSYSRSELPIPGVSETAYNVIAFYEKDRLQARVAYTWRDDYLAPEFAQYSVDDRTFAGFYEAFGQVDVSLSYEASDNVSLTLEGINITGEDQNAYLEYDNLFLFSLAGETRLLAGVNFRF